jgi:hypothetical protein
MPSAISLMVPSPPAPTMRSAPPSMWSFAIAPAVFGPVVGATVMSWPAERRMAMARSTSARPPRLNFPALGL